MIDCIEQYTNVELMMVDVIDQYIVRIELLEDLLRDILRDGLTKEAYRRIGSALQNIL